MPRLVSGVGITDDPWEPRDDVHSVIAYVWENIFTLEDYVLHTYKPESYEGHLRDLLDEPYLARTIIQNYEMSDGARFERVIEYLIGTKTSTNFVVGAKRHWKTITTCDILNEIHERTGRPLYAVGLQDEIAPQFKQVPTMDDVPKGALVLRDEAGVEQSARTHNTGDQRGLPGELAISGHNGYLAFFIAQNTSIMDKAVLALADNILIKPTSMLQMDTERTGMRPIMKRWKEILPQKKYQNLFLSKDMNPWYFDRPIPPWWREEYSHAYASFETDEEALAAAARWHHEANKKWSEVALRLSQRGFRMDKDRLRKRVAAITEDRGDGWWRWEEARTAT